jgi:hypothetical protein
MLVLSLKTEPDRRILSSNGWSSNPVQRDCAFRVSGFGAKNLMRPKSDSPSGHETTRQPNGALPGREEWQKDDYRFQLKRRLFI